MWRQALFRPGRAWASPKIAGTVRSGEQVTLYAVKMKPRKSSIRKFAFYALVATGCYITWGLVVSVPLEKIDPSVLSMMAEDSKKEQRPLAFLPLPFTDRLVSLLPYAGKEEEWQEFIKFNADHARKERVKQDLNMLVKRSAEKSPLTRRWAKNGESFSMGPSWVIMSFPERPPPVYVRKGIELGGPKGFEIKTKRVDSRTKALFDRIIVPYPIACATWSFFKTLAMENVSTVAKYFRLAPGGKDISTSNPNPDIEKTLKKLQAKQTAGGNSASGSSASTPSSSSSPSSRTPSKPSVASDAAETEKTPETPEPKNARAEQTWGAKNTSPNSAERPLVKQVPYYATTAGHGPWAAFKETYKRNWKPLRALPPRGSLAVHGLVSLDSPKGRIYIDVFAWYHPMEDKFHPDSLTMHLRSITPNNQRPRR